jgi:hypothetical protein
MMEDGELVLGNHSITHSNCENPLSYPPEWKKWKGLGKRLRTYVIKPVVFREQTADELSGPCCTAGRWNHLDSNPGLSDGNPML